MSPCLFCQRDAAYPGAQFCGQTCHAAYSALPVFPQESLYLVDQPDEYPEDRTTLVVRAYSAEQALALAGVTQHEARCKLLAIEGDIGIVRAE